MFQQPSFSLLDQHGLNMLAVLNLDSLPEDLLLNLADNHDLKSYTQLLVFAHGGKTMWQALQQSPYKSAVQPIDTFSTYTVDHFFATELPENRHTILFPGGKQPIDLRTLGKLAGWHHSSPFRIGIHPRFGTWFAYRVVAFADTNLEPTATLKSHHPCETCSDKPCISACPAVHQGELNLQLCMDYRLQEDSHCATQCLSRNSCPVGREHQYSEAQMQYCYGLSLQTIADLNASS